MPCTAQLVHHDKPQSQPAKTSVELDLYCSFFSIECILWFLLFEDLCKSLVGLTSTQKLKYCNKSPKIINYIDVLGTEKDKNAGA